MLNLRMRKRRALEPVHLHEPYVEPHDRESSP
jgi:hypothetical protein